MLKTRHSVQQEVSLFQRPMPADVAGTVGRQAYLEIKSPMLKVFDRLPSIEMVPIEYYYCIK